MRILVHDYAGHAFPISLSRELARRGHQVTHAFAGGLLTPRGSLSRKKGDPEGLRFQEVPMNPDYRKDKYRFTKRRKYEREYGRELSKLIEVEKPTIVLSGQTPSEPQWTAIKRSRELGIPFVSWIQDFYSLAVGKLVSKKSKILGKIAGSYYSRIDRRCFKHCAHAVAISEDFIPVLQRYGMREEKISVIENWGFIEEMPRRDKQNDWAIENGLAEKQVFMYSGTLAMKHNPEPLLELAKVLRRGSNARVVVISEGPGADYLEKEKMNRKEELENLLILPFQPFDALPNVLGTADVFLALLEPDAGVFSVPSKILSYLCAGKPTVAAMPVENLAAQLLLRSNSGIVVTPGDRDGFVEAAITLLGDEEGRKAKGDAARLHAENNFQIGTVADRFETVFQSAIGVEEKR